MRISNHVGIEEINISKILHNRKKNNTAELTQIIQTTYLFHKNKRTYTYNHVRIKLKKCLKII